MELRKIRMAALVLAIGMAGESQAATVVTGTNVTLSGPTNLSWIWPNDNLLNDYQLGAWGGTLNWASGAMFDKTDKYGSYQYSGNARYGNYSTLRGLAMTADGGVDLYLVPTGAEFSATTIANGEFSPIVTEASWTPTGYGSVDIPFGSFYLGINMDGGVSGARNVFGWAQLNNSSSGLVMISNAMAYGTNGIYIGTTNTVPIPEAETYAMMLIGLALVSFVTQRRKQAEV